MSGPIGHFTTLDDESTKGRSRRPTISRARSLPSNEAAGEGTGPSDAELMPPPSFGSGLANEPHIKSSITEAEAADVKSAKATISDDDIQRWSSLAGISLKVKEPGEPKPQPASTQKAEVKPFPRLAPPPPSGKPSGSRFNLFSRNKSAANVQDDDSDSDDGLMPGYAQLGAPPSDDDDDGYQSDKPFTRQPEKSVEAKKEEPESEAPPAEPPVAVPAVPAPPVTTQPNGSEVDLREVLREVLERLQTLISRSNLIMAEANTEMLEEELRRAKATAARVNARNDITARTSIDQHQTHARTPSGSLAGKDSKGWFNFRPNHSPTPSEAGDGPSHPSQEEEVKRLRSQVETQTVEIESLKKGKKDIEAELEGLSQALFEEANKMVADERKRRAEVEESLKEVKGEREALRETIKVLGGRPEQPDEEVLSEPDGTGRAPWERPSVSGNVSRTQTPNLDKHYAALRKGIHHVVDGSTPEPSAPGTPEEDSPTPQEAVGTETTAPAASPEMPGGFGAPAFDSEPNPWASNGAGS